MMGKVIMPHYIERIIKYMSIMIPMINCFHSFTYLYPIINKIETSLQKRHVLATMLPFFMTLLPYQMSILRSLQYDIVQ